MVVVVQIHCPSPYQQMQVITVNTDQRILNELKVEPNDCYYLDH